MDDTNLVDEDEEKKPQPLGDEDLGLNDVSTDTEINLGGSGVETDAEVSTEGSEASKE